MIEEGSGMWETGKGWKIIQGAFIRLMGHGLLRISGRQCKAHHRVVPPEKRGD